MISKAKYEEAISKCTLESEANPKEVDRIRKEYILFNNEHIRRFLKCFYKELNFINGGDIDFSKMAEELQPRFGNKRSKEIVNNCSQRVGKLPDEIDYVYAITECLFQEIKKPAEYHVKN